MYTIVDKFPKFSMRIIKTDYPQKPKDCSNCILTVLDSRIMYKERLFRLKFASFSLLDWDFNSARN